MSGNRALSAAAISAVSSTDRVVWVMKASRAAGLKLRFGTAFLDQPVSRNYGEDFMRIEKEQWVAGLEFNRRLNADWRLRLGGFVSAVDVPEEQFFNYGFPPLSGTTVNRSFVSYDETQDDLTLQAELYGRIVTGPRQNRLRSLTATSARPLAMASRMVLEIPSAREGNANTSMARMTSGTSLRSPASQVSATPTAASSTTSSVLPCSWAGDTPGRCCAGEWPSLCGNRGCGSLALSLASSVYRPRPRLLFCFPSYGQALGCGALWQRRFATPEPA